MLTTIIKNDGEDNVVRLTYENLWHELKNIPGAELIIAKDWVEAIGQVKNNYVCLVEADCLVSERYFDKQIKEFRHNPGRKISMLTAKTSVAYWDTCFYGYYIDYDYTQGLVPNSKKKSNQPYPIEVGYMPGAIIRLSMLKEAIKDMTEIDDLVQLSSRLSLAFWRQGNRGLEGQNGNPVYINPNVTYVTTEEYVNDTNKLPFDTDDLKSKFIKESI